MKAYRSVAALIIWGGLLLQYYVMLNGETPGTLAHRTVNFFSYFTVLTNLLAAIALSAPLVAPNSPFGRFFAKPSVRTAIALYMAVTAVTYIFILQGLWQPKGLHWVADTTLHYLAPALFILDWLLFSPKGTLRWGSVLPWLAFPLAYGLYSIFRGPLSGFWPYPFLDVSQLGMTKVLVNMAAMSGLFLVLGLGFVLIDRLLKRRRA